MRSETPESSLLPRHSAYHQNVTLGRIDSGSYQRSNSILQEFPPSLPAEPRGHGGLWREVRRRVVVWRSALRAELELAPSGLNKGLSVCGFGFVGLIKIGIHRNVGVGGRICFTVFSTVAQSGQIDLNLNSRNHHYRFICNKTSGPSGGVSLETVGRERWFKAPEMQSEML